VVIGIIAVLVSLLLPALAGARDSARTTKCLVNVRSLVQSFTLYANDWRESLPYWSAWQTFGDTGQEGDTAGLGWAEQLEPTMSTLEGLKCPSRTNPDLPLAYFMNARFIGSQTNFEFYQSLRLPMIQFSTQFVLTGDTTQPNLLSAPWGTSPNAPNSDPDDARWQAVFYPGEKRVHDNRGNSGPREDAGTANLGFLDGHAAGHKSEMSGELTWHGNAMLRWCQMGPAGE
jgi:prepilin-type processing-associated H-X9-DG protein